MSLTPLLEPFVKRKPRENYQPKVKGLEALERIESELKAQSEAHQNLMKDYDANFDTLEFGRKVANLKGENKQLREELKKLNDLITRLVEARRFRNFSGQTSKSTTTAKDDET